MKPAPRLYQSEKDYWQIREFLREVFLLTLAPAICQANRSDVGHPAETKEPRTQYDEHRVYWQCYKPRKRKAKIKNAKHL